jgi:hypothetical protein
MIPALANGQPAAAAYYRDGDGAHHAYGLGVLTVTPAGIARITVFAGGPDLVAKFGLPSTHPEPQALTPTTLTTLLRLTAGPARSRLPVLHKPATAELAATRISRTRPAE